MALSNFQHIICGYCNQPAKHHPIEPEFDDVLGLPTNNPCDRIMLADESDFTSEYDYYDDTFATVNDSDYSGPGANEWDERWAIEPDPTDTFFTSGAYERWSEPTEQTTEFTSALHYRHPVTGDWHPYQPGSKQAVGNMPHWIASTSTLTNDESISRNVYIEGELGLTVQAFDPDLTHKYALHLLNCYTERDGALRVGGSRITRTDTEVTTTCVRDTCRATVTISRDADLSTKQQFIYDVIRHGNNHAANWFIKRASFYKLHTDWCDLNCDQSAAHCGTQPELVQRMLESWLLTHNFLVTNR